MTASAIPQRRVLWVMILLLCVGEPRRVSATTDAQDAAALRSLMGNWQNTPGPSWGQSDDPCGTPWEGVVCSGSKITRLSLSSMGIKGTLSGDIGQLSELRSLDLSSNNNLEGPLLPNIGNLQKLTTLILAGCSFSGSIPSEIGNLRQLTFLALNSNKFTGKIPPSLGQLSQLYWFDIADNQLTGTIPVSSGNTPGLDKLVNTKHFHFNKNQLSGPIPPSLFSSEMKLIHVLFDGNQLTGEIPDSLALVTTLEVLRLDRNVLTRAVPSNINNLTRLGELHLANNKLTGGIPDLTGMSALSYVDLSNNSFTESGAPTWFSKLQSLNTLVVQSGNLVGEVPSALFSIPQLEQLILSNNKFNGTLDMGTNVGTQLQIVDFQNNDIARVTLGPQYKNTLMLAGNPVCNDQISNTPYCRLQQQSARAYSTSLAKCGPNTCPPDQSLNPQSCDCAYPYTGILTFRGPRFRDLTNSTRFQALEMSLWTKLQLTPGSVSIQNPFFNSDDYIQMQLQLFPSDGPSFNRSEVQRLGFDLTNQTFKPPDEWGPYAFLAFPYNFQTSGKKSSMSAGVVAGIAAGCAVLALGLIAVGVYALRQKRRAERAVELSKPFASWAPAGKDSGGAPQLKGARWFSFDDLRRSTNNFSEANEIGSGGYGKVYRGIIPGGQLVAIKRAQHGSMQGGLEFKTEIELLSRVHHKNLVALVGFCFEQGEQMLVYEYVPNGTLRESLAGKTGIHLDWKRRLRIALGSARGLTYLHELANPPIIHRDVKSSNILLDEHLTAKVADFGLSKLVSDSEKGHVSTQVKGTLGYLDPEYYMTQQLTDKSDVYSFGVVMLELISAKQPIERGKYIVREVKTAMDRRDDEHFGLTEIMDPALRGSPHLPGFGRFVELAVRCVEESAADRPTMSDVVKEIEAMLQNDGLTTNSTSASSSATEFAGSKGSAGGGGPRHPYNDALPSRKEISSDAFDYSGGYSFSAKVEPK